MAQEKVSLIYEIKQIGQNVIKSLGENMDKAKVKARELEQRLESMGKIGKTLAVGAGAVATALGVMGLKALKAAGELEQQTTALTVLTGSAEKAKNLLNEINKVAVATPFEQKDIINATSNLMAFGVAQEKVIPTFKILGDISQGNTEKLNSLVRAYGKVQAKGKASMEEIQMVAEAGVPIIQSLADTMGLTKDEVFKLSSQGKISSDIFNKAMESMTLKGGIFFDSMTKQSTTMGGLWSTLQGNVALVAQAFGNELLPYAKQVVQWFNKILTGLLNMSPAMKKTIVIIGAVTFAFATLLTGLGAILAIAPAIAAGWVLIGGAISAAIWPVTLAVAAVIALIAAYKKFENVRTVIDFIGQAIYRAFVEPIVKTIEMIKKLIEWFSKLKKSKDDSNKSSDSKEKKSKDEEQATKEEKKQNNLDNLAAEEDAKTELMLQKDAERNQALLDQQATQREEKKALEDEWNAIIDEEKKAQQEEKDIATAEKMMELSNAEIMALQLTEEKKNLIIAAQERKRNQSRLDASKEYVGFLAAAAKNEEDIGKAAAQGTLDWAKKGLTEQILAKSAELIATGTSIIVATLGAAPQGWAHVAAGIGLATSGISAVNSVKLAEGGSMIVDQPTRIGPNVLAGEAGPERIDVTPLSEQQPQTIVNNIVLDGEIIATKVLKVGQEMRAEGTLDDGL